MIWFDGHKAGEASYIIVQQCNTSEGPVIRTIYSNASSSGEAVRESTDLYTEDFDFFVLGVFKNVNR